MGYTTTFRGTLELNKQLTSEDYNFLVNLNKSRRMKLKVDKKYGVEGEFYVNDDLSMWGKSDKVIDNNTPPSTQPSLWCQWVPTEDRFGLEWDEGEKAYNMEDWIFYIINRYLAPRGYVVNGTVEAQGEEQGDIWAIKVEDNVVRVAQFEGIFSTSNPKWVKTIWENDKKIPLTVKEPKTPKKKVKNPETIPVRLLVNKPDKEKYIHVDDLIQYVDSQLAGCDDRCVIVTLGHLKNELINLKNK